MDGNQLQVNIQKKMSVSQNYNLKVKQDGSVNGSSEFSVSEARYEQEKDHLIIDVNEFDRLLIGAEPNRNKLIDDYVTKKQNFTIASRSLLETSASKTVQDCDAVPLRRVVNRGGYSVDSTVEMLSNKI